MPRISLRCTNRVGSHWAGDQERLPLSEMPSVRASTIGNLSPESTTRLGANPPVNPFTCFLRDAQVLVTILFECGTVLPPLCYEAAGAYSAEPGLGRFASGVPERPDVLYDKPMLHQRVKLLRSSGGIEAGSGRAIAGIVMGSIVCGLCVFALLVEVVAFLLTGGPIPAY